MDTAVFEPIGHLETAHRDMEQAPSQGAADDTLARVIIEPHLVAGLLGLDRYDHLWLITWLDRLPEERPLRLIPRATEATGEVQGVFASRAPVRPCGIGLSLVRRVGIAGNVITVRGVDLLDGTPVLDLKPWFSDCDDPNYV